jgi:hypothetical protein
MLSSNHSYLVYTPFNLFLWHGSQVDTPRLKGSLHVLKTFYNQHLNETFNYIPSYDGEHSSSLKFRVELQSSESRRFKSLFEGAALIPPAVKSSSSSQTQQNLKKAKFQIISQMNKSTAAVWEAEDRLDAIMMSMRKTNG